MNVQPNNPLNRPAGDPRHHPANVDPVPATYDRRSHSTAWLMGALALIALVGVFFWAMSGEQSNVASTSPPTTTTTTQGPPGPPQTSPTVPQRNPDTNTGQTAPAPR
jgi:hypothetical protein